MASYLPAPKEILSIVEEELTNVGGRNSELCRQGSRVYLRATVPHTRQVRPNDHVQGGVAVSTSGRAIYVYPYIYRQICRSGAVMALTDGIKPLKRLEAGASSQSLTRLRKKLRELVQRCASAEMLAEITEQLQAAASRSVEPSLQMSAVISRIPRRHSSLLLSEILSEFHDDEDTSAYALMNAVTVVARDEEDPHTKWELEKLAGGVPTLIASHGSSYEQMAELAEVS